jgi:subtilisin family serine protease
MRLLASRAPGTLWVPLLSLSLLGLARVGSADTSPASLRLDPALAAAARQAPADTFAVWVTFRDKGEAGPSDLAARLAAAESALTPRARARRLRAHVWPLVDERDLPVDAGYLSALERRAGQPLAVSRWLNQAAVRVPGASLPSLAAASFVSAVSPVERVRRGADPPSRGAPLEPPAAPRGLAAAGAVDYGLMLSTLSQIDVPPVHAAGFTGAGILVTVLDEGFNWFTKHEAFQSLVVPTNRQRDFVRGVWDVQDTTASGMTHGTQVLGCLAGQKVGTYVGDAFGADYALARTEIQATETAQEMLYWGMGAEWADSLGADIISSSLVYTTFDHGIGNYTYADMNGHTTIVSRAAEIAAAKGILVVNAVGNYGSDPWHYLGAPSDVNGDSLIAVGAVNSAGVPASFTSYGPSSDGRIKPDLVARGVSVPLVLPNGQPQAYTSGDGTSFATPQIAGLAACLMQAHPEWTPRDVARALRATASQAGNPDNRLGYGVANGGSALRWNVAAGPAAPVLQLGLHAANPVSLSQGPITFTIGSTAGNPACTGRNGTFDIYDATGRRVGRPWAGVIPCSLGLSVSWDGRDREGHLCGAGLYIAQLRAGSDQANLRLIVLP